MLGTDEGWFGVFENSALENIFLPSTLKRIEYNAFKDCKNLKNINLPNRLEFIGKQCFMGSTLEFVDLPSTLMTIERSAFRECQNLSSVEFPASLRKIA